MYKPTLSMSEWSFVKVHLIFTLLCLLIFSIDPAYGQPTQSDFWSLVTFIASGGLLVISQVTAKYTVGISVPEFLEEDGPIFGGAVIAVVASIPVFILFSSVFSIGLLLLGLEVGVSGIRLIYYLGALIHSGFIGITFTKRVRAGMFSLF